jgi:hypothetical protein
VIRSPEPGFLCYRRSRDKERVHDSKLWEEYKLKGKGLHEAATGELERQSSGPVSRGGSGGFSFPRCEAREEKAKEVEEVRKFRQKRSKAKVHNQFPTYWTIGQLGIPYGATAMGDQTIVGYTRKVGSQFIVFSEDGERLGAFDSKAAAVKRLAAIEWFKAHKNEQRQGHV